MLLARYDQGLATNQATFLDIDFDISSTSPSKADESTARRVDLVVPSENWGITVYTSKMPRLDGFFDALVSGKYAIPSIYPGDPVRVEDVIKGLSSSMI